MSERPKDVYLGDGVYAGFDGFHIILDLRAQDPSVRIALEPVVYAALREYARVCWPQKEEHQDEGA